MSANPYTQTKDVSINPNDRMIEQSHFYNQLDSSAVYGGHYPCLPYRPAEYQQNWSGLPYWQTWDLLDYPVTYRRYVTGGNVGATVTLLLSRNQADMYERAPIAISQYALNTQQVYVGSDYTRGY